MPDHKIVSTQQKLYRNIKKNVRIGLYVKTNDNVVIYEGKKDKTTIKDVYQLKMYWDGCVLDGIQPTKAILISSYLPNSVSDLVKYVNRMYDLKGNKLAFPGADFTFLEQSFAAVSTIAICAGGAMGLPLVLSEYRHRRILKRFRVTPVSPSMILAVEGVIYAV